MPAWMTLVGALVLVCGCAAWLALGLCAWRSWRRVPQLAQQPAATPGGVSPARVSLIIPVRDEIARLEATTRARLASEHAALQLVIVDDRSRDGSAQLADRLAAEDSRITVVHVTECPEGWLGKVWAMSAGLRAADGEWLLFSDADVHFEPTAISRALALCSERELDLLAVLPELHPGTVPLDLAVSAFGRLFLVGTRAWAVSDPRSSASIGVGAFNLVRRSALKASGGLSPLRLEVADDLALGQQLKRSGARCEVALGHGLVSLAWYARFGEFARGLEKGLYGHVARCEPWRLLLAAPVVLLFEWAPWCALLLPHGCAWLTAVGAVTLLSTLPGAALAERAAGRRPLLVLLSPLGGLLLAYTLLRAAWCGWRRGGVLWRGRLYPDALIREAAAGRHGKRGC